nr:uncharacterized protein LOC111383992 [Ipomoea batatas]
MRDRGKAVEIGGNNFTDFNEMPCKKHPSCSSVGICPQCLKDRLVKLIKKSSNGFWKIKRLFARGTSKREKSYSDEVEEEEDDDDHAHQVFDEMRVSRSRSLCSFRDEGSDQYRFSSAKISDVTGGVLFDGEEPRKSGFRGGGGGEKANFPFPRSVFPVKESDFSAMDESAFIDIKLDLSSSLRLSNASDHDSSSAISLSTMKPSGNGMLFGFCSRLVRPARYGSGKPSSPHAGEIWSVFEIVPSVKMSFGIWRRSYGVGGFDGVWRRRWFSDGGWRSPGRPCVVGWRRGTKKEEEEDGWRSSREVLCGGVEQRRRRPHAAVSLCFFFF